MEDSRPENHRLHSAIGSISADKGEVAVGTAADGSVITVYNIKVSDDDVHRVLAGCGLESAKWDGVYVTRKHANQ